MGTSNKLDRRSFLLHSVRAGTAAGALILPGCDSLGLAADAPPANGSAENPWTLADPGPSLFRPTLFAANVDARATRLWVEVLDGGGNPHPARADSYVDQIFIEDNFNNPIANAGFSYTSQARMIETVYVDEGQVTEINAWSHSTSDGWFRANYDVAAAVKLPPAGDTRRPLTLGQPGKWGEKTASHLPIVGRIPGTSRIGVEVGDRSIDKLHPMTPDHYIGQVLVFDQYDQVRYRAIFDPQYNVEPSVDIGAIGGTDFLRVISSCNLHDWWEAIYRFA